MEEDDKGCPMIRMGVSGWVFLPIPAYPGCPGPKAVKRLCVCIFFPKTLPWFCGFLPLDHHWTSQTPTSWLTGTTYASRSAAHSENGDKGQGKRNIQQFATSLTLLREFTCHTVFRITHLPATRQRWHSRCTPAKAGTRLSDPGGCKAELT